MDTAAIFRPLLLSKKKLIFTNLLNLHLYLNGVGLVKEAFSICSDVSRTSQGFRHHPGA